MALLDELDMSKITMSAEEIERLGGIIKQPIGNRQTDDFHVTLSELRHLWKLGKRGQEDGTLRGLLDTHMRLSVWILRANYWKHRALEAERLANV